MVINGILWPGRASYIVLDCKLEYLFECVERISSSYWISFQVTYMVVCCEQDLDGVLCGISQLSTVDDTPRFASSTHPPTERHLRFLAFLYFVSDGQRPNQTTSLRRANE